MTGEIEAIVAQWPLLRCKLNKDKRQRISRDDIRGGSLWVRPATYWFYVELAGPVDERMCDFLRTHFGPENRATRNKSWKIEDIGDISTIIRHFGELSA